jgi:hypothetical protein
LAGDDHKKKYRLAKWGVIYRPKDQGGLGVLNLELQNKCLLSKWLFNLINSDGARQQLIRNKYLGSKAITRVVRKPGQSQFLSGMMNVKDAFLSMGNFNLQDGKQIRFWEDIWLGATTLKGQYPNLYNIVWRKSAMAADIFSSRPLHISFQRNLVVENLQSCHNLVMRLTNICLTDRPDNFKWLLNSNGRFSDNSMYQAFLDTNIVPNISYLWKIKILLKIKVFVWLLYRKAILIKDNLVKRNWYGNVMCCFCNSLETIQHLLFDCVLAKFLWRVIQLTFGILAMNNIKHVFGGWVQRMNEKKTKNYYL